MGFRLLLLSGYLKREQRITRGFNMMTQKELWIAVHKAFIEDHGREPTQSEMHEAYAEALGDFIDEAGGLASLDEKEAEAKNLH